MNKNIFVIGLDDFHLDMARKVRHADTYTFHGLLDYDEIITPQTYPFDALLQKAERQLNNFEGTIDGIIIHWDFPASTLLPIICQRMGLQSASLESVLKCEHKYWARLEQSQVVPELTPRFEAVDPFDDQALDKIELSFPFWLKPVKSFGSHLGFRINNANDFAHAISRIRCDIPRLGDGFNQVLSHADLPGKVADIDGYHCIAEEITEGKQCGLEGYVHNGMLAVHGVIDGVKDAKNHSFTRWEYPSVWPQGVQDRMLDATRRLMEHVGFDNSPFGIEFFWDASKDQLWILEVNTRISQSHSDQFIKVEGVSNHEVAIDVALGREPEFGLKLGKYSCAAKFMLRRYRDVTVTRIPTGDEIAAIEHDFPDSRIVILVKEGQALSSLRDQDSYSYEIANIFLGAQSQQELLARYHEVASRLNFAFSDGAPVEDWQFVSVKY